MAAPSLTSLEGFRGTLVQPGDAAYDEARVVYNAMIDRYPALIARCADADDVVACVDLAREQDVPLAVRGGGHNAGGLGVWDDALVIDLSGMNDVDVDPVSRRVRAGGGALLRDVDAATHAHGLAVPMGVLASTGVGGLTLGGGLGYLSRKHGLSIDSLLAAEVVLADGSIVIASEDSHPDLFWAIRGGGGNFGVVTAFEFQAQPVANVVAGPMLWPLERSAEILRAFDEHMCAAPEELGGFFAFLTVPPAPPFPEELHLRKMCGIVWCWSGAPEDAEAALAPMRALEPVLDGVAEMPLPMMNGAFDALYPAGLQWYWKAAFVDELTDEAIAAHVEHGARVPTMHSSMHLYPIDGAVHDVACDDTAWAYRSSRYACVIVGVDPDPANAPVIRDWARDYHDAIQPHSADGAYVNFLQGDEGEDRVRATYGANHDRLVDVKRRYDPANLFRINHNIAP
jgi:FAD binding domain-containing protein/berberine-like enzyme